MSKFLHGGARDAPKRTSAWPKGPRKRHRYAGIVLAGFLALAAIGAPAAYSPAFAAPMQALNSRVVLELPAGYAASKLFSGFQNDATGVSYVILELPTKAYDEIAAGFEPDALAKRGLTDAVRGSLPRGDTHIYMRARQQTSAGAYAKFFVLFKTADQTVLVSANAPVAAVDKGSVEVTDIERVLAGAHTADKPARLDLYSVGYLGPFKPAGTFVGTSTLYTLDGRMEPERKGEVRSTLMITPSLDQRDVTEPERLATSLMTALTGFKRLSTGKPQRQTINGVDAIALDAEAFDGEQEAPVRIHQTLLMPKTGGYVRLVGIATEADKQRLAPEFARIAESISLKE